MSEQTILIQPLQPRDDNNRERVPANEKAAWTKLAAIFAHALATKKQTPTRLARQMGYGSTATVYGFLKGNNPVPSDRLLAGAVWLGIDPEEIKRIAPYHHSRHTYPSYPPAAPVVSAPVVSVPCPVPPATLGARIDAIVGALRGLDRAQRGRVIALVELALDGVEEGE
jgi:hypothetical protein